MPPESEQRKERIPEWLTVDLLVICVPLVIIVLAALVGI
jgi:hypothetical protein